MIETTCRGQAALYQRICEEFVGVAAAKEALAILAESDSKRKKVSAQGGTVEGKKKRAEKRARKSRLLQRQALRAANYTYIMSDERAAEWKREDSDSGSETETDAELHICHHTLAT